MQVMVVADLLGGDRTLVGPSKLLDDLVVVSKISLESHQDDWEVRAEVHHLRDPLARD